MKLSSIAASILLATAASASDFKGGAAGIDHAMIHARSSHHRQLLNEERYARMQLDTRGHPGGDLAAMSRRNVQERIARRHASNGGSKKKCKAKTASKAAAHLSVKHDASKTKTSGNFKGASHQEPSFKHTETSEKHSKDEQKSADKNKHKSADKSKYKNTDKNEPENKSKASHDQKSSSSSSLDSLFSPFGGKGLFGLSFSGSCTSPQADDEHPNGKSDFLACGINKYNPLSAWNPPHVKLSDLKMISSSEATKKDVFKPCAPYKSAFDQAAQKYRIPSVLLMSFALQESTCQPHLDGNNGEVGIMQITSDKCEGHSREACKEVSYNVDRGAAYVRRMLDEHDGNALAAFGAYNGWEPQKMTYASATSRKYGCYAQNNLDYINQLLNGFCQGKDGYSDEFKVFGNLAACG